MEKQKILVVDDDKHIAELISLYMMKEGYETQEIYDGKEAAAAVEGFQPDLILLDLMLPEWTAIRSAQRCVRQAVCRLSC